MLRLLPLLFLASLSGPQDSSGSYGKLYPVDEGARDESFAQFRRQLRAAVDRRDVRFIESILDPEILNSFGGDGGPKEFRETWKLDRPSRSTLWRTLRSVLSMGSGEITGQFCAPYVFAKFPDWKGLDDFYAVAVIKKKVPAYDRPDARAPVRAYYSYDVLNSAPGAPPGWLQIQRPSGQPLYIRRADARSPIDYRACFHKREERWFMTTLVAGD